MYEILEHVTAEVRIGRNVFRATFEPDDAFLPSSYPEEVVLEEVLIPRGLAVELDDDDDTLNYEETDTE